MSEVWTVFHHEKIKFFDRSNPKITELIEQRIIKICQYYNLSFIWTSNMTLMGYVTDLL